MSKFLNEKISSIETYIPGEQPKDQEYIKLNTNENPYPPSPKVLRAIKKAVNGSLRLYPDPNCELLRNEISKYYSVSMDEVFVGNGSDEVLSFSFAAFFDSSNPILFPDVSYSFYPVFANYFSLKYQTIEVENDFSIKAEKYLVPNGGVILPNPNAPTSIYLDTSEILKIVEFNLKIGKVVIVDEAYIDFGEKSVIEFVHKFPNLIVIQTLSKSRSLAGLRVGFAIADKDLIRGLNKVKESINSYTVDRLALIGATEAFKDEKYFQTTRNRIVKTRNWVTEEVQKLGFSAMKSGSNFLFLSHPKVKAHNLYMELKNRGVLVRYFDKRRIANFIRVSIGTDKEMRIFLEQVGKVIEEKKS